VKINRLEDFNKELKLDFDRKVELFKLKEYNWKMDNETYLKLETENRTLKTMVLENKTEIESQSHQINELEMMLQKKFDLKK
jgi:hypothetical protein